jgi:hypothetical protein
MSDLGAVANTLGLAWSTLDVDERDRLLVAQTVHPEWPRETKVQFTRCGTPEIKFLPPQPKRRFFKMVAVTLSPKDLDEIRGLKVRRLILELGFRGAALLPAHRETFDAIADLLIDGPARPLSTVTEKNLAAVRKLVAKLPLTVEATRFLRATVNGVEQRVI